MIVQVAKTSATNLSRRLSNQVSRQAPRWMSSEAAVASPMEASKVLQEEVAEQAGPKGYRHHYNRHCGRGVGKVLVLGGVGYGGYYLGKNSSTTTAPQQLQHQAPLPTTTATTSSSSHEVDKK